MSNDLVTLKALPRKKIGKSANRQLRQQGYTPAVFYTPDGTSIAVQVKEAELNKLYATHGRTKIFTLVVEDGDTKINQPCLIWDAEYFPTKRRFQHVDFYGVDLEKELRVRSRLVFKGTPVGVRLGGKLEVSREQLYIFAKPQDIPSSITVDIANLKVNQGLRVADLVMPEGVRAHYTDNYAILLVNAPGAKEEEDEFEESSAEEATEESGAAEE